MTLMMFTIACAVVGVGSGVAQEWVHAAGARTRVSLPGQTPQEMCAASVSASLSSASRELLLALFVAFVAFATLCIPVAFLASPYAGFDELFPIVWPTALAWGVGFASSHWICRRLFRRFFGKNT